MKQMERLLFEKEVATKVQGRYKTRVFDSNNQLVREQKDWAPNLILNSGLDKIAYMPWANVFQFAVNGTGTTPTKIDTATTASQSGTTVTIQSGPYQFTSDIVGKLIYWPGVDKYANVLAFIDNTTVTVDVDQNVSGALFYVYNVDQTALVQPYSMHCRYVPGEGLCGTTIEGNTIRLLRTYDFYMEKSPVLITEVGFKDQPASPKLFSRVVLQEPQFLAAGQYFQISYELAVTLEPGTPTVRTVDVSGWPISPSTSVEGTEMIQSIGMAVVDLSGVTIPHDMSFLCNEPFAPGTWCMGPEYGYTNRWKNGLGEPTKDYGALSASPFEYNRNFVEYYLNSDSGSYIPRVSAATTDGVATNIADSLFLEYNVKSIWPQHLIALSSEYMIPVVSVPPQWGKMSNDTKIVNISFTPEMSATIGAKLSWHHVDIDGSNRDDFRYLYTLSYDTVYMNSLSTVLFGQTIVQSKPDNKSPRYSEYDNIDDSDMELSAWSEIDRTTNYESGMTLYTRLYGWLMPPYDPFVTFPNTVHRAEFTWPSWTHTFSPSASGLLVTGSSVFMSTTSAAPAPFGTSVDRSLINTEIPLTLVPYVTGSCERLKKATFLTNYANGSNWYTIGIGPTDTSINVTDRVSASKYNGYVYVFNEPQTKFDTHILNVFFKYSWRRDLST